MWKERNNKTLRNVSNHSSFIVETNMDKEYVVIGLGRFGGSIVRELNALDMDVMAIDRDEKSC